MLRIAVIFSLILAFGACVKAEQTLGEYNMKITSPEFENGKPIPERFTCQGEDVNPRLMIEGIPQDAKSLALILDDPDAPTGTFVHWVAFDIPVIGSIEENSSPGKPGANTLGRRNYMGPCPPSGTHRYFFKIYALDVMLNLEEGAEKNELENAMQGHILAEAQFVGLYKSK